MDKEAIATARAFGLSDDEARERQAEAEEHRKASGLEVWPENWRPVLLAVAMQTQVRTTMSGAVAFDYTALPVVESRIGFLAPDNPVELADEFAAFRTIERIYFSK